ncbi:hypothetical protein AC1031_015483 [Aphanomyces cochlioides]|nr:hypothetical protein AC1031_015483 [Aphanomyces cochlioides]
MRQGADFLYRRLSYSVCETPQVAHGAHRSVRPTHSTAGTDGEEEAKSSDRMDERRRQRRWNSPVKVHFDKPTTRGWGFERGLIGERSERAKAKDDNLFRFNQEQKQRAEENRRMLENTQQNQAMSRCSSLAREVKHEAKSGAPAGTKAADCKEASPNTQNRSFRKGKNAIKRFKKNKKKTGPAARRARRKAKAAAMQDTKEEER